MNKKIAIIIGVLVLLLVVTGVVVYKAVFSGSPVAVTQTSNNITTTPLPPVDSSISVDLIKSATAGNTVSISVKGMENRMVSIAYELTYDIMELKEQLEKIASNDK